MIEAMKRLIDAVEAIPENVEGWMPDVLTDALIDARQAIKELESQEPVQVSPLEFVEMVMEKEHLIGKPIFWAEWPNKEKNNA